MGKIVFITDNSPEIRKKLQKSGFTVCICAEFEDSVWLDYHPDGNYPYDIHGTGYCEPDEYEAKYSPLERIKRRLKGEGYYSEEREFYNTVEEFLSKYGNH